MKEILLVLDFLFPVFFFLLGRVLERKKGRVLIKESVAVFFAALFFAPIVYLYSPLAVQGACTALLIFLQFALVSVRLYREKILL